MAPSKKHGKRAKAITQTRSRTTRSKGRPLADPEQNTQLLTEQLRSLGLYAAETVGDGNCLFRSLSDQIHGSPTHHLQLRREICDWIETHRQRYEPFCEDERGLTVHLQCMRLQGTYGGHLELSAFAHFARRNVKVIQPGLVYVIEWNAGGDEVNVTPSVAEVDGPVARENRRLRRQLKREEKMQKEVCEELISKREETLQEEFPEDTVYVAYHDWEHFSSVRNLRGPHAGIPCVRELPADSDPPPSPAKKLSRIKSKPVSTGNQKHRNQGESITTKAGETGPASPTQIPLPASCSESPSLSPCSTPDDIELSNMNVLQSASMPSLPAALRIPRSPKRTFDESSGSSTSDAVAKRTRNSGKLFSREGEKEDHIKTDDLEESASELSAPASSRGSTPLSSATSSLMPTTPRALTPPRAASKPLTRRQRKTLGLPKSKATLMAKRASAGKIVIPGGRFRKGADKSVGVHETGDDNEDEGGNLQDHEWRRNGTGRLDVRGFRELKI